MISLSSGAYQMCWIGVLMVVGWIFSKASVRSDVKSSSYAMLVYRKAIFSLSEKRREDLSYR